jgi:cell division protein FtsB
LLLVAGLLAASTVVGGNGLVRLVDLRDQTEVLSERAFQLMQENAALRERIARLHGDDFVLETLARRQLGLVREGDIVYRFAGPDDGPPSLPPSPAP